MLHDRWGEKLRQVFDSIESPNWGGGRPRCRSWCPLRAASRSRKSPRRATSSSEWRSHPFHRQHAHEIVFSHGNSFPSGTYSVLFDHLRQRGFDVSAVDRFGHDPRFPVTNNWPHLVEQLAEFAAEQVRASGGRCTWWAIHWAAFSSVMAAAMHPELARGVLMIDSPLISGWRATTVGVAKRTQVVGSVSPAG